MSTSDVSHEEERGEEPLEPHLSPSADLLDYLREYAREKPEIVALWCLGIGFVLGWKLKPW
jgi:hypothetical protein